MRRLLALAGALAVLGLTGCGGHYKAEWEYEQNMKQRVTEAGLAE